VNLNDTQFLGNPLVTWLIGAGVFVGTVLIFRLLRRGVLRRLSALSRRTTTELDDIVAEVLDETKWLFLLIMAAFFASRMFALAPDVRLVIARVTVIALLFQAGIWANTGLTSWLARYRKHALAEDAAAVTTMSALGFAGKLVLWSIALLLVLDNLGIDITALVAGLGVGGIAVALAVQNVLGDLFASLSIVFDRPFVIGDFLAVDDLMGNVEHIGLKTTRMRSISGEQLIFSNADLLASRIRNYGRMFERRVLFTLGVTYDTSAEKLEAIPAIIRECIEAQEHTRFGRSHFKEYGDFSLNVETVYYVTDPDYNAYMDIQQSINLTLLRRFADEGIEFAYPTQMVILSREGGTTA